MRAAVLAGLILLSSCGKVAQPRPPFIRIPAAIRDLSAGQNGYDVVLSWTNPPRYIDGSPATDLSLVIVESEGKPVAWLASSGAGKAQSYPMDSRNWLGQTRSFAVRVQTGRTQLSELSNLTQATPVPVPGGIVGLKAVVDQHVVTLIWQPPIVGSNPPGSPADGYIVSRVDPPEPGATIEETQFSDPFEKPDQAYTYVVNAARKNGEVWIAGSHPETISVTTVDVTPPKTPTELEVVTPEKGAYITWKPNDEADLAGYHLYRGAVKIGGDLRTTNSFFDPDYTTGSSYSVSAVDESGNESRRSPGVSPR